jgi:hypothetical protein
VRYADALARAAVAVAVAGRNKHGASLPLHRQHHRRRQQQQQQQPQLQQPVTTVLAAAVAAEEAVRRVRVVAVLRVGSERGDGRRSGVESQADDTTTARCLRRRPRLLRTRTRQRHTLLDRARRRRQQA